MIAMKGRQMALSYPERLDPKLPQPDRPTDPSPDLPPDIGIPPDTDLPPDYDLPPDELPPDRVLEGDVMEGDGQPVFDRAEEDPIFGDDDPLPMDDEGNILPGADPSDDDPNDNGDLERNDPDDLRRLDLLGQPMPL